LLVAGDSGIESPGTSNSNQGSASEPIDLTITRLADSPGGTYLEPVDASEILEPVSKKMFIDSVPYYLKAGLTLQVNFIY